MKTILMSVVPMKILVEVGTLTNVLEVLIAASEPIAIGYSLIKNMGI